ncbi:hypothetical protein OG21DRAFT_1516590 [Imleria badia]|nr:hypothetical protein OG21DRAFT_1516590 [Imleria badia]
MLAQISFCILAWTFAGFMMHRTIALPDSIATWIESHPSDTQVILTLFSTILALTSSFLLGKAVQYALVRCLSNTPLGLHTMVEWAKLAQRSISFDRRRLSWTLLSVAWVGLLGFLTTAWSSLLAPQGVVIYYDFQGNDADFLSSSMNLSFQQFIDAYQLVPGFTLTPIDIDDLTYMYFGIDLVEPLMEAGFCQAASTRVHGAANFISIYNSSYISNISTGGIFPSGNLTALPSSPHPGVGNLWYQGLSRTYNVTQHGFTADISCRAPTSNDPAITLNLTNSVEMNVDADDQRTWYLDTYSWSANCSSEIKYSTMGVTVINDISPGSGYAGLPGENGLLMTSICFGQSFTGSSNQSFLILFNSTQNSTYSAFGPQVCQVTPLITTVRTTYDQTGIINVVQPPLYQQSLPDPTSNDATGILLRFAAFTLWSAFVKSQGLSANMIGDKLLALNQPGINFAPGNYIHGLESYLRGMMEYLGSLMGQLNTVIYRGQPGKRIQFYGTLNVHTFGWSFHLRTHGPSLAAITLVTLLTVAASGCAMMPIGRYEGASKNRKLQAAVAHAFNPTETTDVLLASSAGDLARVLSESESRIGGKEGGHDHHGHEERLRIVLGVTDMGRPTLRSVSVGGDETRAVASSDVERRDSLGSRDDDRLGANDVDDGLRSDVADCDGSIEHGDLQTRSEGSD